MSSGKSEVANILISQGYERVKLAHPVKEMARAFFRSVGYSHEVIDRMLEGDLKEQAMPVSSNHAVVPRELMQKLGTEMGRDQISLDLWISIAMDRVDYLLDCGKRVVVDDVRYPNEIAGLISMGAHTARITRPGVTPVNGHSSEGGLNDHLFDSYIDNDADLVVLRQRVVAALRLEG